MVAAPEGGSGVDAVLLVVSHAAAVNQAGKKVFDKPLPNSEPKLRELFDKLQAKHGKAGAPE